ncbi:hypothetical protein DUNSADRAFT_16084 [Dunaliella salina]|uniref:Uncharacterized protein n=1 Tax=Dunaliella salina TaxID=3046 RepID=A0ABQ7G483_DUNSA|nr:hypothetical protein DUNSADRAFT_16084 [Dunaliella salina]|eukprot:KAF5829424.1 hypothetical protein DUNSADRAFT_16084 [Dunaliella salina]
MQPHLGLHRRLAVQGRSKVACKAIEADAATRVRGHTSAVYQYFVNPANFPAYRPAIQESRILKGYGPDIRSQWQLSQSIGRMQVDVTYDIEDLQPNRRAVYSLTSDLYTGTEQTVFMPDPNDPSFTVVRTVSSVELNLWKRAMQPFLSGSFKAIPEQNLQQLAALLNSAKSPIRDTWDSSSDSGRQASKNPFTNFFSGRRARSGSGQAGSSYDSWARGSSSKAYGATKKVEASGVAMLFTCLVVQMSLLQSFGTFVEIETIQRRLAWPLRKDNNNQECGSAKVALSFLECPDEPAPSQKNGWPAIIKAAKHTKQRHCWSLTVVCLNVQTFHASIFMQVMHPFESLKVCTDSSSTSNASKSLKVCTTRASKQLARAYEVLKDPEQKQLYDEGRLMELQQ